MANSTYSLPEDLLIELRIDCHAAAPLGVTVSPPLLNVMPLAAASAADQTEVTGGGPPPPEPPQPLMVIGVAPIAAGGGAKNPAIQTAVAPATGEKKLTISDWTAEGTVPSPGAIQTGAAPATGPKYPAIQIGLALIGPSAKAEGRCSSAQASAWNYQGRNRADSNLDSWATSDRCGERYGSAPEGGWIGAKAWGGALKCRLYEAE